MKPRILLVEDEEHIAEPVKLNLEIEGYTVTVARDGQNAINKFGEEQFNLVILDIMLPHVDGIGVCENIRARNSDVPILFLSARSSGDDRVLGLKKGGDDYLTKPFNLEELILRVQRLIERNSRQQHHPGSDMKEYRFGDNYINFISFEAEGMNGRFTLTQKELMLLKLLIDHKNEVVSREKILQTVWGYSVYPSTRTIDNFLLAFRKYFEEDPKNPRYFLSVRGVGYKFCPEGNEQEA